MPTPKEENSSGEARRNSQTKRTKELMDYSLCRIMSGDLSAHTFEKERRLTQTLQNSTEWELGH